MVARELFLGLDVEHRRLAYSVQSERLAHHSASFQVEDAGGGRSRLTWTADVRVAAGVLGRVPA